MAERKLFAGARIRRIRKDLNLTQTAMAESIGISPSYLNLIERNQRPLTVQLLIKLSSAFKIDLDELQGEASGSLPGLREVFADPSGRQRKSAKRGQRNFPEITALLQAWQAKRPDQMHKHQQDDQQSEDFGHETPWFNPP